MEDELGTVVVTLVVTKTESTLMEAEDRQKERGNPEYDFHVAGDLPFDCKKGELATMLLNPRLIVKAREAKDLAIRRTDLRHLEN